MNYTGQVVQEVKEINTENYVLDLDKIEPGLYLLEFSLNHKRMVYKLIAK